MAPLYLCYLFTSKYNNNFLLKEIIILLKEINNLKCCFTKSYKTIMSEKKKKTKRRESDLTNRVKVESLNAGASPRLLSIFLDVKYTTVSKWNSNSSQPTNDNMESIGELIEKDFRDMWEPQGRANTGLARAAEAELDRLREEEGLPFEIEVYNKELSRFVKTNNPELVKKIRKFIVEYKKKHQDK